jgi:hypothetical protein
MRTWFLLTTVANWTGAQGGLNQGASDGRPTAFRAKCAGTLAAVAMALPAWTAVSHAQTPPASSEQPASVAGFAPAVEEGLSDLEAMTFGCVKAGLNAAAREAAKVPAQGTYQFAYFNIISDSHHSSYEVFFKSNYQGEADLKYCVSMYCQQGWDPKTTKTSVSLMDNGRRPKGIASHSGACSNNHAPAKH